MACIRVSVKFYDESQFTLRFTLLQLVLIWDRFLRARELENDHHHHVEQFQQQTHSTHKSDLILTMCFLERSRTPGFIFLVPAKRDDEENRSNIVQKQRR